jgi:Isochorismatase family
MKEMLPPIDPAATALLVMDYQPLVIGMLGESEALLAGVAETLRVVRKTRVGAFCTTDLDRQLKERGVVTLLLAGIATSGVVLSTLSAPRPKSRRGRRRLNVGAEIAGGTNRNEHRRDSRGGREDASRL